jgi:hypothetical protein
MIMKISTSSLFATLVAIALSGVHCTNGAPTTLKEGVALRGAAKDDAHSKEDADAPRFLQSLFTPAQPLSYFRNDINPDIFEWVNKNEVQAGETTCGFLYPPLGGVSSETYPKIKVYFCMKFAKIQPAPKGNIFLH